MSANLALNLKSSTERFGDRVAQKLDDLELSYSLLDEGSARVAGLLASKGVSDIERVRVDLEPARRVEMTEKSGRRTVPQIWIGERHIGGCDDLYDLDRQGGLDPLLKASS